MKRVVTGRTAAGRSHTVEEGPPPTVLEVPAAGQTFTVTELWSTRMPNPDLAGPDPTLELGEVATQFEADRVVWRLVEVPPADSPPFMHNTPTLDFTLVVSGQVELVLDDSTVALDVGDAVVLRGESHGWRVIGTEPCVLASVNLAAQTATAPTGVEEPR